MTAPAAIASGVPAFAVIPGAQVHKVLDGHEADVIGLVETAYRLHAEGRTINPDSYFLRFPDRPSSRIIALPASVTGESGVHGLKWISSFPENVGAGIPRASAVAILNDQATGYPLACLEGSIISASRTAASAALAAGRLSELRGARPRRLGIVGTGLIARYIHTYLAAAGFRFDSVGVHDLSPVRAREFAAGIESAGSPVTGYDTAAELVRAADLVVFATVAGRPHLTDPAVFAHHPLVLHISLRDLAPEVILAGYNVVDDIEHCLKADTSVHLAQQRTGSKDFIAGTLYDALAGTIGAPAEQAVIFSPFGLGVLDLVLAKHVYDTLATAGELRTVPDFFPDS